MDRSLICRRPLIFRLAIAALAALCFAAVLAASAAKPPAPGSLFLHTERFALEDGSLATAERGLLFVPIRRGNDSDAVLSIEFYRFPAADPSNQAPPLFVLNGGPGFPGLRDRLAEPGFYESRIQDQTHWGEVVVVGQRGIGSSAPNTICSPGSIPAVSAKRCRDYWESQELDLQGFTVIEAAADVADLAAALGYRKINLLGGSFGSHWGMAVQRFHPQLVARAVLHGLEGPDHTYDSATGLLDALKRMAAAAEAAPTLAAHIPEGGLIAGFEQVIERLGSGPLEAEATHPETGAAQTYKFYLPQVRDMLFGYTSSVRSRERIRGWAADLIALVNGDLTRAAEHRLQRELDQPQESRPPSYRTASYFMLDCSSGISAERAKQFADDPAKSMVGDPGSFYRMVCAAWDADLGDEFRAGFTTNIPTVLIHGDWDVSTPYSNALEVEPMFANGKLITIVGGTHGAFREVLIAEPSLGEALGTFFATGAMDAFPERVELPPIDWEVPGTPTAR